MVDHLIAVDPGVSISVDGVYLGRQVGQNWSLSNIERLEVLRGPQGTPSVVETGRFAPMPGANFGETGPFTEALMLVALAERRGGGKRIEWDAKKLRITNDDKLNEYINPPARIGFDCGRG